MIDIKKKVRAFIVENFLFGVDDELTDATSFLEDGVIDSTGILELVEFIEEEFSMSIDEEELMPENLDSLNNIELFLTNKLQKK